MPGFIRAQKEAGLPGLRWLLAEGFPGAFSPTSVTQAITALVLLVVLVGGCGGTSQHLAQATEFDHPFATIEQDINPPSSVDVSCYDLIVLQCEVSWSGNGTWDYVLIYRSTTNDFSTSVEVHRVWAAWPYFSDRDVERGQRYFYWARFEDRATGEQSDVTGPASACYECPSTRTVDDDLELGEPETGKPPLPFPRSASEGTYTPERAYLLAEEVLQAPVYHDGEYLFRRHRPRPGRSRETRWLFFFHREHFHMLD